MFGKNIGHFDMFEIFKRSRPELFGIGMMKNAIVVMEIVEVIGETMYLFMTKYFI